MSEAIGALSNAAVGQTVGAASGAPAGRTLSVLGVRITDMSKRDAVARIDRLLAQRNGRTHSIFIVNAHTLNLATDDSTFRDVLNSAGTVFGDGTGVRWAARQRGIRLRDNLVGTDLVPELFAATAGQGRRYYLVGTDPDTIRRAAATAQQRFPGWTLAGYHHGYINDAQSAAVVERVNASGADVLLVGMGNPLQERWIHRHEHALRVPVAIGVGGLFDHWAGNIRRAPGWVRWLGYEWVQLLLQQPKKWRRYLLGNPKFLLRITAAWPSDLRQIKAARSTSS
jgi:N-acetylglucosaminyldiphosphoundecaprenol N-acetyl-beta-D-mannosaminyltransferase